VAFEKIVMREEGNGLAKRGKEGKKIRACDFPTGACCWGMEVGAKNPGGAASTPIPKVKEGPGIRRKRRGNKEGMGRNKSFQGLLDSAIRNSLTGLFKQG